MNGFHIAYNPPMNKQRNKSLIVFVEYAIIFLAFIWCIRWVANPQGPFEPVIALCTLVLSSIDLWRRSRIDAAMPVSIAPPVPTLINQMRPRVRALKDVPVPRSQTAAHFSTIGSVKHFRVFVNQGGIRESKPLNALAFFWKNHFGLLLHPVEKQHQFGGSDLGITRLTT
jgi:hypothetical protein